MIIAFFDDAMRLAGISAVEASGTPSFTPYGDDGALHEKIRGLLPLQRPMTMTVDVREGIRIADARPVAPNEPEYVTAFAEALRRSGINAVAIDEKLEPYFAITSGINVTDEVRTKLVQDAAHLRGGDVDAFIDGIGALLESRAAGE